MGMAVPLSRKVAGFLLTHVALTAGQVAGPAVEVVEVALVTDLEGQSGVVEPLLLNGVMVEGAQVPLIVITHMHPVRMQ